MSNSKMRELLSGKQFELPEHHDLAKKVLVFTELWGPKPGTDAAKNFQIDLSSVCEAAIRLFLKRREIAKKKRRL